MENFGIFPSTTDFKCLGWNFQQSKEVTIFINLGSKENLRGILIHTFFMFATDKKIPGFLQ